MLLEDLELFNDYWVVWNVSKDYQKFTYTWDESEDYYLPLQGKPIPLTQPPTLLLTPQSTLCVQFHDHAKQCNGI